MRIRMKFHHNSEFHPHIIGAIPLDYEQLGMPSGTSSHRLFYITTSVMLEILRHVGPETM